MSAVESRQRILKAATELFLEGGLAALSVRAIAKRAGLSTIGIYSHFDGKQGILDTLYIEGFERVAEAMRVSETGLSAKEKALQACANYLQVAERYGAHYRLIFGESDDTYTPSPEARAVAQSAFQSLLDIAALFLPEDASLRQKQRRALETWAIVHGYVGLQNHLIAREIEISNWQTLALESVAKVLDSAS
jgi:AcrR family transcriptional regulator